VIDTFIIAVGKNEYFLIVLNDRSTDIFKLISN
jgi:hypothetical protein